jgi:hypothetical protein
VVGVGTFELAANPASHTGRYLKRLLSLLNQGLASRVSRLVVVKKTSNCDDVKGRL